jgi:hypothetical protein
MENVKLIEKLVEIAKDVPEVQELLDSMEIGIHQYVDGESILSREVGNVYNVLDLVENTNGTCVGILWLS